MNMRKILGLVLALGFFLVAPLTVSAACSPVALGGTGACTFVAGILYSPGGTLPLTTAATSSLFTFPWTISQGGTGQTSQTAAFNALAPNPTRAGDLIYWNGSNWINLAGNNSGTQVLQETSSGVPSWVSAGGTGTVTSVTASTPNSTLTLGGTNPITTTGTISFDLNLSHPNYWTALQNFTNASTSQLTATSSVWLTSLATSAGTFLAVDPNGKVIATTTPTGAVTSVSNSDGTLTISPTSGAVIASLALTHPNTWTGLQSFNNATSTLFSSGTSWFTSNTGVVLSTDANGKLQNTTISSPLQFSGATLSCPTCSTTTGTVTSITAGNGLNGGTITSSGTVSLKSYISTSSADTIGYVPFWATTNGTPAQLADNSTFNFATASNLLTFTNGSSTALTATGFLGIPASSNPSPTINGSITESTNAPYQLHIGGGGTTAVYDPRPAFILTVASTTVLTGTTTSPVFSIPFGLTVTNVGCTVQPGGATAEIQWQYANPTTYTNVTSTYLAASSTPGITSISSNNTPAIVSNQMATSTMSVGSPTGNATSASCSFYGNSTAI